MLVGYVTPLYTSRPTYAHKLHIKCQKLIKVQPITLAVDKPESLRWQIYGYIYISNPDSL
jgi:hypothetical protein